MKNKPLALCALAALTTTLALGERTAHAGSCDSATKVSADIWAKHDDVVKALGCAVVAVASDGAVPPNACLDVATKVAQAATQMISFWNQMVGNSWATIGPRELTFGAAQTGKLVSTGGREFISSAPVETSEVELKIKKTDGKAKTSVVVCKDNHGKKTKLWEFEIDNGDNNVGQVWTKTLTGMRGYVLTVHMDAGSVTNTMSYSLTATKKN